jgi:hypothetical protein
MAKKLKAATNQRYRSPTCFGPGAMAISYGAVSGAGSACSSSSTSRRGDGGLVPRLRAVPERRLNRGLAESPARNYCVRAIDAFERCGAGATTSRFFEFVENGADLGGIFERESARTAGHVMPIPFTHGTAVGAAL